MKLYYEDPHLTLYHGDCMDLLATLPDKAFDLAIVDPPYGIGEDGRSNHSRDRLAKATRYPVKHWDRSIPEEGFFQDLSRVSANQIIWGLITFLTYCPAHHRAGLFGTKIIAGILQTVNSLGRALKQQCENSSFAGTVCFKAIWQIKKPASTLPKNPSRSTAGF